MSRLFETESFSCINSNRSEVPKLNFKVLHWNYIGKKMNYEIEINFMYMYVFENSYSFKYFVNTNSNNKRKCKKVKELFAQIFVENMQINFR